MGNVARRTWYGLATWDGMRWDVLLGENTKRSFVDTLRGPHGRGTYHTAHLEDNTSRILPCVSNVLLSRVLSVGHADWVYGSKVYQEEYRASSTSKRGLFEVMNQAGNPNPNSCSTLARCLDWVMWFILKICTGH